MPVICDAPVIWWPRKGVRKMDLKRVYFRNVSHFCVQFGSHWRSKKVQSCVSTRCGVTGNIETFKSKFYHTLATWQWKLPSYLLFIFCRVRVNSDNITIVMRHLRNLFIATTAKQIPRGDWYASALSKCLNRNLKIFFLWCMIRQPNTYEMKQESGQS